MKQYLLILTIALVLSMSAHFCSKPKQTSTSSDSARIVVPSEIQESDHLVSDPLGEADTILQAPNAISFILRASELWADDSLGHNQTQLSFTQGTIQKIFPSPSNNYVACLRRIDPIEEPGLFEKGKAPLRAIHSIMVFRSSDLVLVREFTSPPGFERILQFRRWISDSRFLCNTSDSYAVDGAFVYDVFRDSLQRVTEDYYWLNQRAPPPNKPQTGLPRLWDARTPDRR
jgi:hypothetical protein